MYKNIKIEKISTTNFIVRADSERFGLQEIVYQGISFDKCLQFLQKEAPNTVKEVNGKLYLVVDVRKTYLVRPARVLIVRRYIQGTSIDNVPPHKMPKTVKNILSQV